MVDHLRAVLAVTVLVIPTTARSQQQSGQVTFNRVARADSLIRRATPIDSALARDLYLTAAIGDRGTTLRAYAFDAVADIDRSRGRSDSALYYYDQSATLYKSVGEWRGHALVFGKVGSVYGAKGDRDRALYYLDSAYATQQSLDDYGGQLTTLSMRGNVLLITGWADSAVMTYKLGDELAMRMEPSVAQVFSRMAVRARIVALLSRVPRIEAGNAGGAAVTFPVEVEHALATLPHWLDSAKAASSLRERTRALEGAYFELTKLPVTVHVKSVPPGLTVEYRRYVDDKAPFLSITTNDSVSTRPATYYFVARDPKTKAKKDRVQECATGCTVDFRFP